MPIVGRRLAVVVATAFLAACTNGSASTGGGHGAAGGSGSQSSETGKETAVRTFLTYAGTYDETVAYTATGPSGSDTVNDHIQFTFRESVSLSTPKSAVSRQPTSRSAVSTSQDRPVYFSDSGSIVYTDTPHSAENCTASISGVSGISDWATAGGLPPVEIDIIGMPTGGNAAKGYGIQVNAALPAFGGRAVKSSSTAQGCYSAGVLGNLTNSPGIYADPEFQGLERPGPRENPFLILPLNTKDYSRHYLVDKTAPYTGPGISGTDTVKADATINVNPTVHLYAALGDSFSSGTFNDLIADTPCKQSVKAYPMVYDSKGLVFLACSGASSTDILETEVAGIPPNAKVVSLTAGGDDLEVATYGKGLFGLLIDCIVQEAASVGGAVGSALCQNIGDILQTLAQLPTVQGHVQQLIAAIHEQAPDAKIFVLGYPNPLPQSYQTGTCPALEQGFRLGSVTLPGLSPPNTSYAYRVVGQINTVVENAVTASGVATYVEPFTGHDVCDPQQSWFIPLAGGAGAPLHPNGDGHAAMAAALAAAAGAPPP